MPDRLALIIANDEYADARLSRLVAPSQDASALAEALQDPVIGDFQTMTLVNADHQAVAKAINRLYQRRKKDDLLLLYYSGHGIKDDYGDLYLAVRDTETDLLSATAIEAAFIRRLMDKCQSRRNVVLLDCCYSGAFFGGGEKAALGSSVGLPEVFAGNGYGRVILTASNALEYAWEGEQIVGSAHPSVFTHYLVLGLESGAADINQDGFITLDELYDFVYEQMLSSGESHQTPLKWAQKVEGQIIIARNPHIRAAQKTTRLPKLAVKMSYKPEQPRAGEEVRWTVSVTNNSQEELDEVEVHRELNLLRQPFSIPVGAWRLVSFDAQYPEPGDYVETVEISANTGDGRRVFYEASKTIEVGMAAGA